MESKESIIVENEYVTVIIIKKEEYISDTDAIDKSVFLLENLW